MDDKSKLDLAVTSQLLSGTMLKTSTKPLSTRLRIIRVVSDLHVSRARRLFKEYAAGIGISLCFQNFGEELANLPGDTKPTGALFLAEFDRKLAGCVAVHTLDRNMCEMKRLYVRPKDRGQEIGRALVERVIVEARQFGHRAMVLDTLSSMKPAITLYDSFGFKKTGPYWGNVAAVSCT